MKKICTLIVSLLLSFILLLFSCNNVNRETKFDKIKVGYIPIADCGQLFVAVEKGYFKEEHLDVEVVNFAGGAKILEALAGGSIDIGFSNVISLILSRSGGLDFKAITGGPVEDMNHRETAIMLPINSKIKNPKELEGLRFAVNTRKNIMELMLIKYFEKYKLDYNSLKLSEIPFQNMEQVLALNQVDAITTIEPFLSFAKKNGKTKIFSYYFTEVDSIIEISSYNASEKYILANPETTKAFQNAMKKATEFAINNESELKNIVSKYTNLSSEQLSTAVLPTFYNTLSVERLQVFCDKVFQLGWTDKPVDAKKLVN